MMNIRTTMTSVDNPHALHVRLKDSIDAEIDTDGRRSRSSADPLPLVASIDPIDERDRLLTLLTIQSLWMDPVEQLAGRERLQLHLAIVSLKNRLEGDYLVSLDDRTHARCEEHEPPQNLGGEASAAWIRQIAHLDMVPEVYQWVADRASWEDMLAFLALEGGPDAGFDDLVAVAQVGLHGRPKVALGRNYWDEMGRGHPDEVHTVLHDRMVDASTMPRVPHEKMSVSALRRIVFCGVLATNRSRQLELLGALGLIELQAGPRCRAVVRGLERVGAPAGTLPFYREHSQADPIHGKEWLDSAVMPLADRDSSWGARMARGALWRHVVNDDFFAGVRASVAETVNPQEPRLAA